MMKLKNAKRVSAAEKFTSVDIFDIDDELFEDESNVVEDVVKTVKAVATKVVNTFKNFAAKRAGRKQAIKMIKERSHLNKAGQISTLKSVIRQRKSFMAGMGDFATTERAVLEQREIVRVLTKELKRLEKGVRDGE